MSHAPRAHPYVLPTSHEKVACVVGRQHVGIQLLDPVLIKLYMWTAVASPEKTNFDGMMNAGIAEAELQPPIRPIASPPGCRHDARRQSRASRGARVSQTTPTQARVSSASRTCCRAISPPCTKTKTKCAIAFPRSRCTNKGGAHLPAQPPGRLRYASRTPVSVVILCLCCAVRSASSPRKG